MSKTTISEYSFLERFNTEEKAVEFFEMLRDGRTEEPALNAGVPIPTLTHQESSITIADPPSAVSSSLAKPEQLCSPVSFLQECGFMLCIRSV